MGLKITGLDELNKELNNLSEKANSISGENHVSFEELFPDSFMQKYTEFKNIDEFELKSNFDFSDIDAIPELELDRFVSEHSTFSNWSEMLTKASQLWTINKLGL